MQLFLIFFFFIFHFTFFQVYFSWTKLKNLKGFDTK
jgi:hypothetical protein